MKEFSVCGLNGKSVESKLRKIAIRNEPKAIGLATAFLSLSGARKFLSLHDRCGAEKSHIIAGSSGAITHPDALELLANRGHVVRLGSHINGIFHPKLLVGGDSFLRSGPLSNTAFCYIGSANFTHAGLTQNIEVAFVTENSKISKQANQSFSEIWNIGIKLTARVLEDYRRLFSEKIKSRSIDDLSLLDIVDLQDSPRSEPIIEPRLCNGVFVGLETFTGEHAFQVEFPKKAAEALRTIFETNAGQLPISCADGEVRHMIFRYYGDNGMYRINVPNSMPLVSWAREQRQGMLLIWQSNESGIKTIHAKIVKGHEQDELIRRASALGTLGRTRTRNFGWF